ncbi:DUF1501 domain-containing protein [Actinoplanes sp. TRM 88003]|uniref:DUF1501 domain-containing protein n=1 Tax=Paractinoplanes aksuensis TaxID=2939490 RepID=A0ABT1DP45_9ACTN|nr:DUF1501 domain-containing protein [Actinoplanes aksuensis]MCO8272248.1 DUF1501 domain-containing protein [Actinoplanes aksuensis]
MQNCECKRRTLLGGALAGLTGAMLSTKLAFAAAPRPGGDVFVLLSLRGGFDGLSAVVPAGDPAYYKARPGIAVPKSKLIGGDRFFGLHPALAPLLPFWKAGTLGAVQAVGQPAPNRSHFAAMEALERAAPGTSTRTGWLDRMAGGLGVTDPFGAVSVGSARPARVLDGPAPNVGLSSVDAFVLNGEADTKPIAATMAALWADAPAGLGGAATQLLGALGTAKTVQAGGYTPAHGASYPDTELGRALRDVARLIKSDVGLTTATVDVGDWDMHENLNRRMPEQLADFAAALAAFATDLGPDGLARTTLVTISEFGRRVAENGSAGLDHGYGNAMFLLGGHVKGGRVHGRWPGLAPAKLVGGDLAVTTDYRSVIGEVLRTRCGVGDTAAVFPGVRPSSLGLFR